MYVNLTYQNRLEAAGQLSWLNVIFVCFLRQKCSLIAQKCTYMRENIRIQYSCQVADRTN